MNEILSEEELNFLLGKTSSTKYSKSSKTGKNTCNNKNSETPKKLPVNPNKKSNTQSKNSILTNDEKQFFAELFKSDRNERNKRNKEDNDYER